MKAWLVAAMLTAVPIVTAEAQVVGPVLNHCLVEWGASPSPDVADYRVYFSTVAGGAGAVVGTVAAPGLAFGSLTACPVSGIQDGQKYVTVTARDAAGNESVRSGEVPFAYDGTAPAAASNLRVR